MNTPIETLQENASQFFDKVMSKYSSQMKCAEGCSKCCFTSISIFEVEANRIKKDFLSLSESLRLELKKLWATPNAEGACSFLYQDRCSIYSSRPIICRTQGAPLFVASQNVLDYCPLNFKEGDPPKEDWLNLERLNTLLSFAAKSADEEKRVDLKKLKKELLDLE